jgi:uncharacterized peroxidase-related enzyme
MSAHVTKGGFTTEVLDWAAWIKPVDITTASEEQLAVLEESGPHAKTSQYYHLLLHDAPVLRERSRLFNAIMYGSEGLPRAERELGAAVESILNGCVYCTSVHARFYLQLAKRPATIEGLFEQGLQAQLEPRERAIADFSAALAQTPPAAGKAHIHALREVGLSDEDIADLANSVAMFAWANRLMLTLGEPRATVQAS